MNERDVIQSIQDAQLDAYLDGYQDRADAEQADDWHEDADDSYDWVHHVSDPQRLNVGTVIGFDGRRDSELTIVRWNSGVVEKVHHSELRRLP